MNRGAFIVLEGGDRCGKTTQAQLLLQRLNQLNMKSMSMHFPDRSTPSGQIIHEYLTHKKEVDDKEIHLLFSKNRWEAKDTILQHLLNGTTLIVDRYAYSGVAFTAAKGFDVTWCKQPDVGLPQPDLVFYLDVPNDIKKSRVGYGQERYELDMFQEKVKHVFLNHLVDGTYWKIISADRSIDEIHQELLTHVLAILPSVKEKSILELWNPYLEH